MAPSATAIAIARQCRLHADADLGQPAFHHAGVSGAGALFGTEPVEIGLAGQEAALFARLAADPFYAAAFSAAFPDRPAPDLYTITRALGAYPVGGLGLYEFTGLAADRAASARPACATWRLPRPTCTTARSRRERT